MVDSTQTIGQVFTLFDSCIGVRISISTSSNYTNTAIVWYQKFVYSNSRIILLVPLALDEEDLPGKRTRKLAGNYDAVKGRQSLVGPRVSYKTQVYTHFPSSYNGYICPHLYHHYITAFITMSKHFFLFNGNVLLTTTDNESAIVKTSVP